jgi:hypothetical protein
MPHFTPENEELCPERTVITFQAKSGTSPIDVIKRNFCFASAGIAGVGWIGYGRPLKLQMGEMEEGRGKQLPEPFGEDERRQKREER